MKDDEGREQNPFYAGTHGDIDSYWFDGDSRLDRVKEFSREQCEAAFQIEGLQKTVRLAIERRIRRLGREAHRTVQEILGYGPRGDKTGNRELATGNPSPTEAR